MADRYRIERELGQGGMATVYLARDLKHDRRVAIKVLRPELAAVIGAARFLSEIKTTANLQHPHILALHDSGELDGTVFYVMPFVEGESLRDRLTREKQLPIDDAIRIAKEVADALHYAHGLGVIHRDIKPENILIHGGHAMVADFGIALAASSTAGMRMTETGMSLGTPTYMSPEQAMGERTLDARTDVYALGCVLYEMLVGDPPYTGSTAQAIVAKVLTEKPAPIVAQRDRVPASVEDAVLAALEKLPADRPASAKAFIGMLEGQTDRQAGGSGRGRTVRPAARSPVLVAAVAALTAGAAATGWLVGHRQPAAASWGTSVVLPDSLTLDPLSNNPEGMPTIALSPDGSQLVFVGRREGRTQLYVRQLSDFSVRALEGSDGAIAPFFSPDGGAVAFFAGTALKQISLAGGQVRTLTPNLSDPFGGAWLPDGRLLIANLRAAQLLVLGPNGDSVQAFSCHLCSLPEPLPDGRRALVTGQGGLQLMDLNTGSLTPLPRWDAKAPGEVLRGTMARLDGDGHLAYVGPGGQLYIVPFDATKGAPTGPAVSVAEGVRIESGRGAAQFALARSGVLAWAAGGVPGEGYLVRADRTGRLDTIPARPANYNSISMTPDGRRLVVRAGLSTGDMALQVVDVESGRVTPWLSGGSLGRGDWTVDGRRVVFGRDSGTFIADPESSAPPAALALPAGVKDVSPMTDPSSFSAWLNNNTVIVHTDGRPTEHVLGQVPVNGTTPDGRWMMAEETGSTESAIVARSLGGSGRRLVIAGGSRYSMVGWAAGGNEFILADVGNEFVKADVNRNRTGSERARVIQGFYAVRYDPSNTDRPFGEPQRLFGAEVADFPGRNYAVGMGGNRFVFKQRTASPPLREVRLLNNWHQRMAAGGRP